MAGEKCRKAYKFLTWILACIIIILLFCYIRSSHGDFIILKEFSPQAVILAVVFSLGTILSDYIFIKIAMDTLGFKLDITEWIGIPAVSNIIGIVVPMRADLIFKGVYYKHRCGVSYSRYLSFTIGGTIIAVMIFAMDFIVSLFLWKTQMPGAAITPLVFAVLLLVVSIAGLVVLKYGKRWILKYVPFKKYLHPIINAFYEVLYSKRVLTSCIITALISNIFGILRLWAIAKALTPKAQIFQAFLYYSIYQFAGLVTVIPGNIGITESLLGIAGSATGLLFEHGVMISLIARLTGIIAYAVLSLIFAIPVVKKLGKSTNGMKGDKKIDEG